ncbi:MAG: hypothetical protein ABUK01_09925 [Leptospirales bacterium]
MEYVAKGPEKCVKGDFVRRRKQPNVKSTILANHFWGDAFPTVTQIGNKITIGKQTNYWYQVSFDDGLMEPNPVINGGFIFGAFLDDCDKMNKLLFKKIYNSSTLEEKLTYRRLYVGERLLPNGKSTRTIGQNVGCCGNDLIITSWFTWKRVKKGIEFNIFYEESNDYAGTHIKYKTSCVITDVAVSIIKERETKFTPYYLEYIELLFHTTGKSKHCSLKPFHFHKTSKTMK